MKTYDLTPAITPEEMAELTRYQVQIGKNGQWLSHSEYCRMDAAFGLVDKNTTAGISSRVVDTIAGITLMEVNL